LIKLLTANLQTGKYTASMNVAVMVEMQEFTLKKGNRE